MADDLPICVAAFYCFVPVDAPAGQRGALDALCQEKGIFGTILIAPEGYNGTIAGRRADIDAVVAKLAALCAPRCLDVKFSAAATMPFYRMKVRVKREIVTMGVDGIDPARDVGTYVDPAAWNALIADPDTIIIDTRNDYEVAIGSFAGAINPQTTSFREFPDWFRANRDTLAQGKANPKFAMFCTGGIRCEKSTAFLKAEGVDAVYHLKGGILNYLETTAQSDSRWNGECFVFDERVAVGHGLALGDTTLCRACRHPLSPADRQSPHFEDGITCPACHDWQDPADRARFAERQKQVALATQRGAAHIGRKIAQ